VKTRFQSLLFTNATCTATPRLELCDVITKHPAEVTALNVDAILRGGGVRTRCMQFTRGWRLKARLVSSLESAWFHIRRTLKVSSPGSKACVPKMQLVPLRRGGIRKFTDEVGRLWTSLADFYIRRGLFEKARDVYEEGLSTVITVRDFSLIFDAYTQFEVGDCTR
jgi:pentatricopeptide repeat protein